MALATVPSRALNSRRYAMGHLLRRPCHAWLAICLLIAACSRNSQVDEPEPADVAETPVVALTPVSKVDEQPASAPGSGLDPSDWVVVAWNAPNLESPLAESEASLHSDNKGMVVKTYQPVPPVHVVLRQEVEGDFVVRLQVIRPSLQELRKRQIVSPTTLHPMVGFRSTGPGPSPHVFLEGPQNGQQTFDAVLRGSPDKLSIWVNGERQIQTRRGSPSSGHVYLQVHGPTELHITACEISAPRKRIWTERTGKRQVEAEFVRMEGEKILLRREGGREFLVPLQFFTDEDQRIARLLAELDD